VLIRRKQGVRQNPDPALAVTGLAIGGAYDRAREAAERLRKIQKREAEAAQRAKNRAEEMVLSQQQALARQREARERFKRLEAAAEANRREIVPENAVVVSGLAKLKLVGVSAGRIVPTEMIVTTRMVFVLDLGFDDDDEMRLWDEEDDEDAPVGLWRLDDIKVSGRRLPAYLAEVHRVESIHDRVIKKELFVVVPTHNGVVEVRIRHDAIKKYLAPRKAAVNRFGDDLIMAALPPSDAYVRAVENLDITAVVATLQKVATVTELVELADGQELPVPDDTSKQTRESLTRMLLSAAVFTIALDTGAWKQAREALQNMKGPELIALGRKTELYDPDFDEPMSVTDLREFLVSNVQVIARTAAPSPASSPESLPPLEVIPGSNADAVAELDVALSPPAALMAGEKPTPVVVQPLMQEDSGITLPASVAPAAPAAPPAALPKLSVDVYGIYRAKGQAGVSRALGKLYLPELKALGRALIPGFDQMRVTSAPEAAALIVEHVKRTA